MYYSYYFDIEKKHRMNFGLQALTTSEEGNGTVNAQFNIYVREILDGVIQAEESKIVRFVFDGTKRDDEDESDYDLDLLRERIASSMKFIFKVINSRDETQNIVIGLITPTAKKNPLGCEIYYEKEPYKAELKAGNLSRLEAQYKEPLIKQTVASFNFNEGGTPDEILLPDGGEYVNDYRLYRAPRMSTAFTETIKSSSKFGFEVNIAPESIDIATEPTVFEVGLNGIGTFALNKTTISFMPEGGTEDDLASMQLVQELTPEFFFSSGLRSSSSLIIEGDGKGNLKIRYADIDIVSTYNKNNEFKGVSFEGKLRANSEERVMLKFDNIIAYYEK